MYPFSYSSQMKLSCENKNVEQDDILKSIGEKLKKEKIQEVDISNNKISFFNKAVAFVFFFRPIDVIESGEVTVNANGEDGTRISLRFNLMLHIVLFHICVLLFSFGVWGYFDRTQEGFVVVLLGVLFVVFGFFFIPCWFLQYQIKKATKI